MSQTKAQLISDLVQALNFTGTASAPANGAFLSAANTLALATNSTQRLTIDSAGRVLLGTTTEGNSSADNLTVADSGESGITVRSGTSNGGHLYFSDATSGTAEYQGAISYQHNGDFMKFNTSATERMRLDSSGRVLIGTSTSKSAGAGQYGLLNIQGGAGTTENFVVFSRNEAASAMSAGDEVSNLTFTDSAGYEFARIQVVADAATGATDTPGRIVLKTTADGASSSTERMRIDSSGRLNIGTDLSDSTMASVAGLVNIHTTNTGTHNSLTLFWDHNNLTTDIEQRIQFSLGDNASDDQYVNAGYIAIGKENTWQGNSVRSSYLSFATSNASTQAERMRITSAGNVGIGTTNPTQRLTVLGGSTDSTIAILTGADTNRGFKISTATENSQTDMLVQLEAHGQHSGQYEGEISLKTGGNHRLRVDKAGNVGIGTTSPDDLLEVSSSTADKRLLLTKANSGTANQSGMTLHFQNYGPAATGRNDGTLIGRVRFSASQPTSGGLQDAGAIECRADGTQTGNNTRSRLSFLTVDSQTATERMRIDRDGEIYMGDGFGDTNRSTILSICGAHQSPSGVLAHVGIYSNDSQAANKGGSISFGGQDGSTAKQTFSAILGAKENSTSGNYAGYLSFFTRPNGAVSVEHMRINSSGQVGIGTSSPTNKLDVNGIAEVTQLCVSTTATHNSSRVNIVGHSTSSHTCIRAANSGGTTLMLLRNDGPIFFPNAYGTTTSAAVNANFSVDGQLRRSTSSKRYKKDITAATWGLAEVLKLKPITFKNNSTEEIDEKTYAGFTAEDVHDLGLTEFVEYNQNNQPDALAYGNMVALMAKAIQELTARVATLEAA